MTTPYRLQDGSSLIIDQHGSIIKVDPKETQCLIPDGATLRVPLYLADAATKFGTEPTSNFNADHARPRTMSLTDEQKARLSATHRKYQDRISNAWRGSTPSEAPRLSINDGASAYAAYCARLASRWK